MHVLRDEKTGLVGLVDPVVNLVSRCSNGWGCFVKAEGVDCKNILEAEKAGLTAGSTLDLALCWTSEKVLTLGKSYVHEPFIEIYGFPCGGILKESMPKNASKMVTFLLRGRSMDNFKNLLVKFSDLAFEDWLNDGCEGDINNYSLLKMSDYFSQYVFSFNFVEATSVSSNSTYYYIEIQHRDSKEEELPYLLFANQIYRECLAGAKHCYNDRFEENHQNCLLEITNKKALPAS